MEAVATLPTPTPPPPDANSRTLVRKLAAVMAEVDRVPKDGRNEFHKYNYATESAINEAVRKGMAERNLMLVPSVEKEEWSELPKEGKLCTLTVLFRLLDGDSGEELAFTVLGQGSDKGDKATYKAMTGALKYALLKLFLIPTGDDPEREEKEKPAAGPQAQGAPGPEADEQARRRADIEAKRAAAMAKGGSAPAAQPAPASSPPAPAPVQAAPAAAPATVKASPRLRGRAMKVWEVKKGQGMERTAFAEWCRVAMDLPNAKAFDTWTAEDVEKLESALHRELGVEEPGSQG